MTNRPVPSATWLHRLNPRQRKKLRVGEYRETGFELRLVFSEALDARAYMPVWEGLRACAREEGLMLVGLGGQLPLSETDAFVCSEGPGTVREEARQAVLDWLKTQVSVREVEAGPLKDAWYGW
ncbi:50S ribosome-binding protein YggL [Uliginosibacterium sp. TH139]|uniref:50S ribosome-binding protein YggL n=1 Tax=Uliginosibacterium sp. TH139 TaxID=2067453 RepID=UPI000C79BE82|nr:50S ribosome-binding protein YggL [Uliginosibacterium sp. TH139]PLK47893.1 hypothetical protein C0V76_14050 [Uliginosibacterium sp. TH139]